MKVSQIVFFFYATILSILVPGSYQQMKPLPSLLVNAMASREMRYHHFIWHNIRSQWNNLDNATQAQIKKYGWAPKNPQKYANGSSIHNNLAGEDFLYMHKKMIETANKLMKRAKQPNITGFPYIPAANDTLYPMPPVYTGPAQYTSLIAYYKSDTWWTYAKKIEAQLKNPKYLKTVSLNELGVYIEANSDIHQGLHFRYSENSTYMRVKNNITIPYIDPKWDVPADYYLIDLYAAQVGPYFWKVHGFVNDVVEAWRVANNVSVIKWNGTWTGGKFSTLPANLSITPNTDSRFLERRNLRGSCSGDMESMDDMSDGDDLMSDMKNMNLTAMEEVIKILGNKGVLCHTYGDLSWEIPKGQTKPVKTCMSKKNKI